MNTTQREINNMNLTKTIPLTKGKFAIVDAEDYEWLMQWKWHCDSRGYAARNSPRVGGKRSLIRMHRVINNTPEGLETDHINMDKLDNRKSNLRTAAVSQNQGNRKKQTNNKSGFKGVSRVLKKGRLYWRASLQFQRKYVLCKNFPCTEAGLLAAARAYDDAALQHFGGYASINEIRSEER